MTWPSCRADGIVLFTSSAQSPNPRLHPRQCPRAQQTGKPKEGRRTNEVSVLEVEAVELVAGLLRIHYVLIDDEGCALGVARDTLSNLAV